MRTGFVYIDSSVVLAHLLLEDMVPPAALWSETLISSRLLDYEAWVRINKQGLASSHGESLEQLLGMVAKVELIEPVVATARDAGPVPMRTLDALHLASMRFLLDEDQDVRLATYDRRLAAAAAAAGIELYPL